MLLKSIASSALLLSPLSYLTAVAGAPQASSSSVSSSPVSSVAPSSSQVSSSQVSASGSSANPSQTISSSPTNCCCTSSTSNTTSSSNGTAAAPHFVIYTDKWDQNGAPDVTKIQGYNVVALSFLLSNGPQDNALAWANLQDSQRQDIKNKYKAAGIKLVVSAFGSTDLPTTQGADPTNLAKTFAAYVKKYELDGIDVDYEDLGAMNKKDGKAEEWLTTFTKALRSELPQGQYILTHAPVAPWFNAASYSPSGAYTTVNKNVGGMIDWYNVQFYNQNDYEDCNTLLTKSTTGSSVAEIAKAGVDMNKIVIGKPATAADATNGYVDPKTLATCISQAKQGGWNAGVMAWQYPNADSTWIKTVRGSAFPESQ